MCHFMYNQLKIPNYSVGEGGINVYLTYTARYCVGGMMVGVPCLSPLDIP